MVRTSALIVFGTLYVNLAFLSIASKFTFFFFLLVSSIGTILCLGPT